MYWRESFCNPIDLSVINEYAKGAAMLISRALLHVYHIACWRVVRSGTFQTFIRSRFRSGNFGNTKSMRVIIRLKIVKIYSRFKKCSKKLRKSFFFRDNTIWTGIVKFSLLRTGYFSSAANVLTSSPKMWHVNTRNVLQLNQFASDQWIW